LLGSVFGRIRGRILAVPPWMAFFAARGPLGVMGLPGEFGRPPGGITWAYAPVVRRPPNMGLDTFGPCYGHRPRGGKNLVVGRFKKKKRTSNRDPNAGVPWGMGMSSGCWAKVANSPHRRRRAGGLWSTKGAMGGTASLRQLGAGPTNGLPPRFFGNGRRSRPTIWLRARDRVGYGAAQTSHRTGDARAEVGCRSHVRQAIRAYGAKRP